MNPSLLVDVMEMITGRHSIQISYEKFISKLCSKQYIFKLVRYVLIFFV